MLVWLVRLIWFGMWFRYLVSLCRICCVYGFSVVLLRLNIGWFCLFMIWMCRFFGVRFSSSWFLNGFRVWFLLIVFCSFFISVFSCCLLCCCWFIGCGIVFFWFWKGLLLLLCEMLVVLFSLIIEVLVLFGLVMLGVGVVFCLLSGLGLWKYLEMVVWLFLLVVVISYSIRKNVIIVVMKLVQVIFYEFL